MNYDWKCGNRFTANITNSNHTNKLLTEVSKITAAALQSICKQYNDEETSNIKHQSQYLDY